VTLIESADVGPPVIDGLVTTDEYAKTHAAVLHKLIDLWFRTISFMNQNLDEHSKIVLDYLNQVAAVKYSVDQYKYSWTNTEVYFDSPEAVASSILSPKSPYYWLNAWDANNLFLIKTAKILKPVPASAALINLNPARSEMEKAPLWSFVKRLSGASSPLSQSYLTGSFGCEAQKRD
jgi:hypothetical protein